MKLNQPVYQLGDRQVAQMAALIERNRNFDESMSRAACAQMLVEKTEVSRRAVGFEERMQILRESNLTVEQLKDILNDSSKLAGITAMGGPVPVVLPKMDGQTVNDEPFADYRSLMDGNNDDQASVASEATQRTVVSAAGVLTTTEDYVGHAAALRKYTGTRLKNANNRYPADAQRAFDKYAGPLLLHYDRNLLHAKALHAYHVDLLEFKRRFATIGNFDVFNAAKVIMADKFTAVKRGQHQFEDEDDMLAVKKLKASNTALLAKPLQPTWQAHAGSAFHVASQHHGPPAGYELRSETAVFWINMHRLAIGAEAFTTEGFVSLAGDAVRLFSV